MNAELFKFVRITLAAGMVVYAGNSPAPAQDAAYSAGTPPAVPAEELPAGSQVLARGPVHEAFAKPVTMDPQAPILVPNQPPETLQEVPPAERPAGRGSPRRSGWPGTARCPPWRGRPPSPPAVRAPGARHRDGLPRARSQSGCASLETRAPRAG